MRPLNCLLFREGNSDEFLLPRLLQRALIRICSEFNVAVAPVTPVDIHGPLVDGICAEAVDASRHTVFFYHYDGSGNLARETMKYWDPLRAAWAAKKLGDRLVRVAPVREMEAWAVADADAVASVAPRARPGPRVFEHDRLVEPERLNLFRPTLTDGARPAGTPEVEKGSLSDPKRTLRELVSRPGTNRRSPKVESYLSQLAEEISLDVLDRLPSFRRWQVETQDVLRKLRFIR